MVVVFEFLSREPIENVITAMNFQVDKLVFFGNHEDIISQKERTENFLRKYCAVQSIVFLPLSGSNLQSVLQTMRKEIELELSKNAKLFFRYYRGRKPDACGLWDAVPRVRNSHAHVRHI